MPNRNVSLQHICCKESDILYYSCYNPTFNAPVFTVHLLYPSNFMRARECSTPPSSWYHRGFNLLGSTFSGKIYDRGHLVSAGDIQMHKEAVKSTYHVVNRVAQHETLNSRDWNSYEKKIRAYTNALGYPVCIVTGRCHTQIEQLSSHEGA